MEQGLNRILRFVYIGINGALIIDFFVFAKSFNYAKLIVEFEEVGWAVKKGVA